MRAVYRYKESGVPLQKQRSPATMRAVYRYKESGVPLQKQRSPATKRAVYRYNEKGVPLKDSGVPLQRGQHCETISQLAADHHDQAARLNPPR